MASIVKRKKRFSVVYNYNDESGKKHQRWETFDTQAEAKRRKKEIEYEQEKGRFVVPTSRTVRELLEEYVSIYGVNTWAMSTYEARRSLIFNYINPIIGDMKLSEINTKTLDQYYQSLLKVKTVSISRRKANQLYLTPHTVREIHKLLRNAFNQAVKWELMSKNPTLNTTLPKEKKNTRDIWNAETLFHALEVCQDDTLSLALNLAFSCSLRMGEMLALTWDCIDISEKSIENGTAYIFVEKELQRVNRQALGQLNGKDVLMKFPNLLSSTHTVLVLKTPKTASSVRKIFLPKTVARMLVKRKEETEELKQLFGDEYNDYNLVFAHSNGRPMESQIINRALQKLISDHNLPKVVFHSLRHSSITYKLKLNGGDIKAVQGDSGHSQVKMVTDVYSHILDEDRRINAQRFEEEFYSKQNPEEVPESREELKADAEGQALLLKLLSNPETAALLKSLAKTV
ncbi:MAG: site-specific integrase [Eubacteriales bacterium]|nr:site-specific integrase [Eubacteriales bacterium]